MAKRSLALATRPNIIVVGGPRRRSIARRAGRAVGRGARRFARRAKAHIPVTAVALGGAIAGYIDGRGLLNALPTIGGSRMLTLGLAGYAATRLSRNPTIRNVGIAAMAAAAFDFGKRQAGGTSGWGDDGGDGGYGY